MNDNYKKYLSAYTNKIEPLFSHARESSEFDFILSLLHLDTVSSVNNLINTNESIIGWCSTIQGSPSILLNNISLWIYCNIVETSSNYELIYKLLNISKGEHVTFQNFKDKNMREMTVRQKIDRLKKVAKGTAYTEIADLFAQAFDANLRNAINHSTYCIDRNGVTITNNDSSTKTYSPSDIDQILNQALALHVSINDLRNLYRSNYNSTDAIESPLYFDNGNKLRFQPIIREGEGLVGIITPEEEPSEIIAIASLRDYEKTLVDNGIYILPQIVTAKQKDRNESK